MPDPTTPSLRVTHGLQPASASPTMPEPPPTRAPGACQILKAALTLFAERGFEGVSAHAIAERAGVSKANVFHHFDSKEALYLAVLNAASQQWGEELGGLVDAPGSFADRLRLMVRAIVRRLCDEPEQSRLLLREVLENGALRGRQLAEDVFARNFEIETAIFRRAQAEGELRAGLDPAMAWAAMVSACVFFFQSRDVLRFNPGFAYADAPERYADGICDILIHGLTADDAVAHH